MLEWLEYMYDWGALMDIAGVSVGQCLRGLATLAFASVLSISSIMTSGFFTAKYLLPSCLLFEWKE